MRILAAVPDSVLWLRGAGEITLANLRARAAAGDIDPQRLIFAPHESYRQHLARLACADLFLDTLPFNAGTSASDALWAGLPVLTCSGQSFASRMAGSLLRTVGLPELITESLSQYEALAVQLAEDPARLAGLRQVLLAHRFQSSLFNTHRFCRHLESAYRSIYTRSINSQSAATLFVAALSD